MAIRAAEGGKLLDGQIIVAENVGVTPEGTLRIMRPVKPSRYEVKRG